MFEVKTKKEKKNKERLKNTHLLSISHMSCELTIFHPIITRLLVFSMSALHSHATYALHLKGKVGGGGGIPDNIRNAKLATLLFPCKASNYIEYIDIEI